MRKLNVIINCTFNSGLFLLFHFAREGESWHFCVALLWRDWLWSGYVLGAEAPAILQQRSSW